MSVRWFFRFVVTGPNELVDEFAAALGDILWLEEPKSRMFDSTEIVEQKSGYLEATVGRNYYGITAIEQMAEQFPALTFRGLGSTQMCEEIHHFEASGGETRWASQETEWEPPFFTYNGCYTRLDGQIEQPIIEVTDPEFWNALTVGASMDPVRIAEFAAAPEWIAELNEGKRASHMAEFIPALERIATLLTKCEGTPRLVARFDDTSDEP